MRVYVLPADAEGCGHSRLVWPVTALKAEGVNVSIIPPNVKSGFMAKFEGEGPNARLKSLRIPEDADVLVLQRPAHPLQPQAIDMMRHNKIAVVVDMDDDMSSIHPDNVAYWSYTTRTSKTPFSWRHAEESCRRATMVTTSTKSLQRVYAPHGRGRVLDNYVPAAYLNFESPHTGVFGWGGTTLSHPNDLQVTGRTVQTLMDEGFPFKVVGGRSKVKQCLRLREEPEVTGSVPLPLWVQTIAKELAVGMIPLAPTSFNTAKSRLKGIEYMAAGVPWVASPREEYRRLHKESGCGFLAETPKQWYNHLKTLLQDEVLCKEQADKGRQYMTNQTYEAQAWRWAEAWADALKMERG